MLTVKEIFRIGVHKELTAHEARIRIFFNQITFVGGIFMLAQIVFFWNIDPLLGLVTIIGPIGCFGSIYIHKKGNFTVARLFSFSLIMISGGLTSVFLGSEYGFHMGIMTVIVSAIICFSKKEALYSIFIIALGVVTIIVVESNIFKQVFINIPSPSLFRLYTLIGSLSYLIYELYFISGLSENTENYSDTKLKKANQTVTIQNKELTLMMREIHHRVKNNLQIIISLLRLRSHDLDDEKSRELFDSTIDRIQSMSLLHQKIYQSKNISKFNVQEYIETLTNDLIRSYSIEKNINLVVNSNIEEIDNDSIVCFALILNELISNSLKHAFINRETGEIEIEVLKDKDRFSLTYKDSGMWKETELSEGAFGIELIDLLTEQISGDYELIKGEYGTEYKFSF